MHPRKKKFGKKRRIRDSARKGDWLHQMLQKGEGGFGSYPTTDDEPPPCRIDPWTGKKTKINYPKGLSNPLKWEYFYKK